MTLEYKNDRILDRGKTLANIKRDRLNEGIGSKPLCNVKDDRIREGIGSSTLCNVKNGDIRENIGSKRLAKVQDIRKQIKNSESLSDTFVAAVWWYLMK
ncbi:MAG: hypothetical protein ABS34_10895 [Opitutaceae bacterium BACL24 MAG-120322-bin51]|jgi:hypothetical protein|nr:MAG: hypothetical protein ABS34_10895 [Opitutaceae bacterium BACL24 MAG-120322-bin51]